MSTLNAYSNCKDCAKKSLRATFTINMCKSCYSEVLQSNSDTIVTVDIGIKSHYKELFMKNMQLDRVVNLSHDAILLTDKDNFILLYNKKFSQIFDITDNIIGKIFSHVLSNRSLQNSDQSIIDKLILHLMITCACPSKPRSCNDFTFVHQLFS